MQTSAATQRHDSTSPPPLEAHDRLTREEFERWYEAMPHRKKAELLRESSICPLLSGWIGTPSRTRTLVGWLFTYKVATPGVRAADNATLRLGPEDEPQPDGLMMIPRERG